MSTRRRVLVTFGAVGTTLLAGCIGDSDGNTGDTSNNDDGSSSSSEGIPNADALLPEPDGYTLNEENSQAAGMVNANNGIQGVYRGEDNDEVIVEIMVFEDEETAANNESLYGDWDYAIRDGTILYAVNGLTGEEAIEFLAAAPELDREIVESNQI
jgi:hypothetical protein